MKKKINQLKAGVLLSYANMVLMFVSSLLITPFMIRALGQNEYGLYQLIGSFAGYLSLLEFGISATTVRYLSKYNAEKDEKGKQNFLALTLIIYSIITSIMIVFALIMFFNIENIFSKSLLTEQLSKARIMFGTLVVGMIFSTMCSVFSATLTSFEEYFVPRLISVVSAIMKLLLMTIVTFIYPSAVILTLITVALGVITNIFNCIYAFTKYKIKIKLHYWDNKLFKEVMKFSLFNFMNTLMAQIYWKLDTIIIGSMMSTAMVSIYSIGMQLNTIILNLTTTVTTVILPRVTKLVTKNVTKRELTMFMVKIGRMILILYAMISIGFLLFGKQFITLWVGEEYLLAYYIALIFIVFAAIPRIQAAANDILKAKNMHGFLATTYVVTGIINVFITIFLVKKIGLIGAALGTAFSLVIGNIIIANIYYEKKLGIDVKLFFVETFRGLWKVIIISSLLCYPLTFINTKNYLVLIIQCIIFSLVYVFNLYIFGLNIQEKSMLSSLLIRKVKFKKENSIAN